MRDPTRPPAPAAEMNITPLIDVLLVLLVIFMAALPLSQRGLDVVIPPDVPSATPPPDTSIVVEVTADRSIAINQQPVAIDELPGRLREIFDARRNKILFVNGDAALRYGDIITVIDAARGAGVERVGVITQRR